MIQGAGVRLGRIMPQLQEWHSDIALRGGAFGWISRHA